MKWRDIKLGCFLVLAGCAGAVCGQESKGGLAATPPMGWNSFQSYGVYLHEEAAKANLEAMAEKLKPYGYEYFVIDNGWFGEYTLRPDTLFSTEKHAHDVHLDDNGFYLPSKVYFPNGFRALVDRCHKLGLKFGVHLMRGIPRKAYEQNLPIKGSSFHARDIADTSPSKQCQWCEYNYRVDMSKPGAQAWYDGLIQHIANLGVDLIKYDDIVPYPDEVEAVAKAVRKVGRPILLSLSPGGKVDPKAIAFFRMANMLRVTSDIWDNQKDLDLCFAAWRKWQGKEQPGFWIDMDMIPFGQLQLMSPPPKDGEAQSENAVALAGKGHTRGCELSRAQMETFITLRALSASPLMVGGDLPTMDPLSLNLVTDREMIACNQNGVMGRLVYDQDKIETWLVEQKGKANCGWLGIFNRSDADKEVSLTESVVGLGGSYALKDIWQGQAYTYPNVPVTKQTIPAHGVWFLRYEDR